MDQGLICQLKEENGETVVALFDGRSDGESFQVGALFIELPAPLQSAVQDKELMAQLGENILIRLAAANGISL